MRPATPSAAFWLLVIVASVALAARVGFQVAASGRPQFDEPVLDSRFYLESGRWLANGGELPRRPFFMSPGYTGFVALCSRFGGDVQQRVVLLQIGADVATCLMVASLALRRLGLVGGAVGGLLLALYGTPILFTTRVLDATLGAFLVALIAWTCDRLPSDERLWRPLLVGLLLGLLALLRSTALLFVPVVIGALWIGRGNAGARGFVRRAAMLGAAAALVIAPVTLRNWLVERDLVLLTSSGGVNFLVGNHPWSDGRFTTLNVLPLAPGQFVDDPTGGGFEKSAREYAESRSGRKLTAGETSDFYRDLALVEIRQAPFAWSTLLLRKLWLFLNAFEVPQVDNAYFLSGYVPWLLPLVELSRLLWPLALFGMVAGFRRADRPGLLLTLFWTYALTIALFFVTDRYRLWIAPLAAFFAATGVVVLVEDLRARRWGWLLGRCAGLLAIGLFCNLNPALFEPRAYARARLGALADLLELPGRDRGDLFRLAPDYLDFRAQHNNMAARCIERGDFEAALAECKAGLALSPNDPTLRLNLRRSVAPVSDAATAAYQQADFAKARQLSERWVALVEDEPEAWNTLGAALLKLGESDAGLARIRRAAELAPRDSKYRYNLALALMQRGRLDEAALLFEALLAQEPDNRKLQELLNRCRGTPPNR